MKKLPHALKSRRLNTAYNDSTPNVRECQHRGLPDDARRVLIREHQEGRDVDPFDEREEERQDEVLRKITRGALRHDQRNERRRRT